MVTPGEGPRVFPSSLGAVQHLLNATKVPHLIRFLNAGKAVTANPRLYPQIMKAFISVFSPKRQIFVRKLLFMRRFRSLMWRLGADATKGSPERMVDFFFLSALMQRQLQALPNYEATLLIPRPLTAQIEEYIRSGAAPLFFLVRALNAQNVCFGGGLCVDAYLSAIQQVIREGVPDRIYLARIISLTRTNLFSEGSFPLLQAVLRQFSEISNDERVICVLYPTLLLFSHNFPSETRQYIADIERRLTSRIITPSRCLKLLYELLGEGLRPKDVRLLQHLFDSCLPSFFYRSRPEKSVLINFIAASFKILECLLEDRSVDFCLDAFLAGLKHNITSTVEINDLSQNLQQASESVLRIFSSPKVSSQEREAIEAMILSALEMIREPLMLFPS